MRLFVVRQGKCSGVHECLGGVGVQVQHRSNRDARTQRCGQRRAEVTLGVVGLGAVAGHAHAPVEREQDPVQWSRFQCCCDEAVPCPGVKLPVNGTGRDGARGQRRQSQVAGIPRGVEKASENRGPVLVGPEQRVTLMHLEVTARGRVRGEAVGLVRKLAHQKPQRARRRCGGGMRSASGGSGRRCNCRWSTDVSAQLSHTAVGPRHPAGLSQRAWPCQLSATGHSLLKSPVGAPRHLK